jgi:hypothetical protein
MGFRIETGSAITVAARLLREASAPAVLPLRAGDNGRLDE